jgi:hypothetical protein
MLSLTFHTHTHSRGAGTRGKECSTGQRRPNYKTKQKRKEKYYNKLDYQRRKGERHNTARIPKEKLEHLPKDHIRRSKV